MKRDPRNYKYKGENRDDVLNRLGNDFHHQLHDITPVFDSQNLYRLQLVSLTIYLEYNECLSYSADWEEHVRYIKLAIEMLHRVIHYEQYSDGVINVRNLPTQYQSLRNIESFDRNPLRYKALRIYTKIMLEKSLDWGD